MPFISCPHCGEEAADHAFYCPACGRPLRDVKGATPAAPLTSLPFQRHQRQPMVIEQTSKQWKAIQAAGASGMILGLLLMLARPSLITVGCCAFAIVVTIFGRLGAWWDHG
jgi:hypothetical protein